MIGAYLGTLLYVACAARARRRSPPRRSLGAALAGVYVERLCFAPMAAGAGIASMVSSFAIWMQLEQAAILVLPRHTYAVSAADDRRAAHARPVPAAGRPPDHAGRRPPRSRPACHLVLHRTRFGLGAARDHRQSDARRISSGSTYALSTLAAFALASAVGGVAGYLVLAVDQQVTPMFGMWATIKGLIAMMLGGLGSIPGAHRSAGSSLGVIEAHAQWYFGPQIRDSRRLRRAVPGAGLCVRPA